MNLLLDTNVIIDFMGRKKPFFEDAQKIIAAGYFGDAKLWMSAQSTKDAYYVLSHYVDSAMVQRSLAKLLEIVAPVSLTADDLTRATILAWPDYEDCLVAISADKAKADYLITRDSKGFERSMVPAVSPTEWLELMRTKKHLEFFSVDI